MLQIYSMLWHTISHNRIFVLYELFPYSRNEEKNQKKIITLYINCIETGYTENLCQMNIIRHIFIIVNYSKKSVNYVLYT